MSCVFWSMKRTTARMVITIAMIADPKHSEPRCFVMIRHEPETSGSRPVPKPQHGPLAPSGAFEVTYHWQMAADMEVQTVARTSCCVQKKQNTWNTTTSALCHTSEKRVGGAFHEK